MSEEPRRRLVFANQLRGLAAFSVALSHLIGVYWLMRDVVGYATFSPVQPGDAPAVVGSFNLSWFQAGPFGVGLFFLISGLVVPISLEQHSRGSFLLARLLRIYPTYVAALAIELLVLYASALNWERTFFYDFRTILFNALLVQDLVGVPSIDMVNWTLGVELKFYLMLVLAAPQIRAGRVWVLFAYASILCVGNIAMQHSAFAERPAGQTLSFTAVFIIFMFIGVLFNFRLRRLVSRGQFVLSVLAMAFLFLVCWRASTIEAQIPVVVVNYGYAFSVFGILYVLRSCVHEVRALDFMASISYPFYLIHSMLGYSVLKIAMLRWSFGYLEALPLALVVAGGIATCLHFAVERPTMWMGRALSRRRRAAAVLVGKDRLTVSLPMI